MKILLIFVSYVYNAALYSNSGYYMEGDTQVARTLSEGSWTPFKGAGTYLRSHY